MKSIKSITAFSLIASLAFADPAAERYRDLVGTSAVTANNSYLNIGIYRLNSNGTGSRPELTNASLGKSFSFGKIAGDWTPTIYGSLGISKVKQDSVNFGSGELGSVQLNSGYLKLGGKVSRGLIPHISLSIGGSGLWMHSKGEYGGGDASLNKYFGNKSNTKLYEAFSALTYYNQFFGYKPYARLTLRYLNINYDFDLPTSNGWNTDFTVGLYTPVIGEWMNMPLQAHFYAATSMFNNSIADLTGIDKSFYVGASLTWNIGALLSAIGGPMFKDTGISFSIQKTRSNGHFEGWKGGIGIRAVKF